MKITVCIGSSCHLKGSKDIVEFFQKSISQYNLQDEVTLTGSFCLGKCNRVGITVQIDDEIFAGVTKENCSEFFTKNVLNPLGRA